MSIFTQEGIDSARRETERLGRELDIKNADHVALWLEANIGDASLGYLAVRIVEAHEAAMLAAAPDVRPAGDQWQPIETAPKDKLILLSGDAGDGSWYVVTGAWHETGNGSGPICTDYSVQSWGYEEYAELKPTRWMLLPAAPAEFDGGKA